jgi:hypothetical protein
MENTFYFVSCSKKQNWLQIDEILDLLIFLVNAHIEFTYALSTSKIKVIIYQSFNVKMFWNTIPLVNFKNSFDLLLLHFFFQFFYTH